MKGIISYEHKNCIVDLTNKEQPNSIAYIDNKWY